MHVFSRNGFRVAIAVIVLSAVPTSANAQGLLLPYGGSVHGSMAGASSATPLDAIGAVYWNPAAIGRLGRSEVSIGGSFLFPDISVSSSFSRPLLGRVDSGTTQSNSGVPIASSLGVVYQQDDSRLTYGMGLLTLAGSGVNFPGDPGNPILSPVGPLGKTVIGPIYSSMTVLQLSPTVAYKVTDRLVLGAGPTIDISLPSFNPAFFAPPSDANGDGIKTFSSATGTRPYWGGGFRAGFVYSVTETLDFGFGYTSQQWLEKWQFNSSDELGRPRSLPLQASLPAIYSWGIAYRGIDRLTLATDLRYIDYANTELFGQRVIGDGGGLGWKSVFAVALGAQYQFTNRFAMQAGYLYNTNPIPTTVTLFNVQAPAITQNTVTVGSTWAMNDAVSLSLGYAYTFKNSISGTAIQLPGAGITLSTGAQAINFNMQFKFGGSAKRKTPAITCEPGSESLTPASETVPSALVTK